METRGLTNNDPFKRIGLIDLRVGGVVAGRLQKKKRLEQGIQGKHANSGHRKKKEEFRLSVPPVNSERTVLVSVLPEIGSK